MPTQIALTFDIEFDINGAFAKPSTREPLGIESVMGHAGSANVGLPRILNILDEYGMKATFFVEALQTACFGLEEMGQVCVLLQQRGHEIQLHLHPVWLTFDNPDWRREVTLNPRVAAVHDSLTTVSTEEAIKIINRGLETFTAWDLQRPTAVRTGSLYINRALYSAFNTCGLSVSSSVGLGVHEPAERELHINHCAREFDDVLELPVTSYFGADALMRRKRRLATLIGMGLAEQRALLQTAQAGGAPFLIMLSHASEFYFRDSHSGFAPNRLTEAKLSQLCQRIAGSNQLSSTVISAITKETLDLDGLADQAFAISRLVSAYRMVDGLQNSVSKFLSKKTRP